MSPAGRQTTHALPRVASTFLKLRLLCGWVYWPTPFCFFLPRRAQARARGPGYAPVAVQPHPNGGRFGLVRPPARTYTPWGRVVRGGELTNPRKTPTHLHSPRRVQVERRGQNADVVPTWCCWQAFTYTAPDASKSKVGDKITAIIRLGYVMEPVEKER